MKLKSQIFKEAAKLVRKGWIRDDEARDKNNKSVSPKSKKAVKFCLTGAIERCDGYPWDASRFILALLPNRFGFIPPHFNDHPKTTKADVVELLEIAAICAENVGE